MKNNFNFTWFLFGVLGLLTLCISGEAHADPVKGKILFKEKRCILCHNINTDGTVFKPVCPGLKNVKALHDREWTKRWLLNPEKVWEANDPDIQDIKERFFKYRGGKRWPRKSFMATIIGKQVLLSADEAEHLIDYLWTLK